MQILQDTLQNYLSLQVNNTYDQEEGALNPNKGGDPDLPCHKIIGLEFEFSRNRENAGLSQEGNITICT